MTGRGLYTDFNSYRIPEEHELDAALQSGIVAVDTNVLLSLYRYNPITVDDLLRLFDTLGARLFIPHQVVREFWRNRHAVLGSPISSNKDARAALDKNANSTRDAIERWAKTVALDVQERHSILREVTEFFDHLQRRIEVGVTARLTAATPTAQDRVLARLERALEGKVGAPYSGDVWPKMIEQGNARVVEQMPPGYMDVGKLDSDNDEGAAGDFLVWRQLLDEGAARGVDLVLVTADVKEDWWERARGVAVGPRRELIEEYAVEVGRRVFFLEPADFLSKASVLKIAVQAGSVEDVERVRDEVGVWTEDAVNAVLSRLDSEGLPQSDVIREAAENGGRVERQRVYEIDGRQDEQMLRGFTRPVSRVTIELQELGVVPNAVPQLLRSHYESGVKTTHFVVPDEVISFFETA